MDKKILWINPVGSTAFDDPIKEVLLEAKQEDTKVEVCSLEGKRGPQHLEYHFYEDLIMPDTLDVVKQAQRDGYDGAVIGCFYDPSLDTAKEITDDMIVVAPAETGMSLATHYGHKFSIIVGRRKWIPQMENNVIKYGLKDRLASFRSVGLGVLEFHEDEEKTRSIIKEEAKKAVKEDNAEVIILGCTIQFGFYKVLQEELGVPVIDSVVAPFKYAEFLAELKKKFGWKHSKVGGFESPPVTEVREWKLVEDYPSISSIWSEK